MSQMTHVERMKAVVSGQEVDRIPYSMWMHMSWLDMDPRSIAAAQVDFTVKHDMDFLKLMPFGLYQVQNYGPKVHVFNKPNLIPQVSEWAIKDAKEWEEMEVLPTTFGAYGNTLQIAQHALKMLKEKGSDTPAVQTIFTPLTNCRKLAGERIFKDMKENPKQLHHALRVFTDMTIAFVKENIKAGVSGFFYATQTANEGLMSDAEYDEFCKPYDIEVANSFCNDTYINIFHLHGDNGMFNVIKDYPCNIINWHDRWSTPNLKEARKLTNKCFLGGLRETPFRNEQGVIIREDLFTVGTPQEIKEHVYEALDMVDGKGIIIGPGCVCDQLIIDECVEPVRKAVASYKK